MPFITLKNAQLEMTLAPQGATVLALASRLWQQPVLRPWQQQQPWHPGDTGLFPMLPLANRVAGNQFCWRGETIHLPESPLDATFFLHGDGWLQRWTVHSQDAAQVTFVTASQHACGFNYQAELRYQLHDNHFQADMTLKHLGLTPMVYGLGFHPFFNLLPESRVQFRAEGYWPEGKQHLPLAWCDRLTPGVDFTTAVTPANDWLNIGYGGWEGSACIHSGPMRVTLSSATPWLMVFRQRDQPFICLEPQSHPVNAHHMAGMPGLVVLQYGETTHLTMRITVD